MRGTLLYDADCGFCTRVALRVPLLRLPVHVEALQSVDLASMGVSEERALREMPFVASDGRVAYGHAAVAEALTTGSLPLHVLGRLLVSRPLNGLAARTYRWVAQNRHSLPGGTPACELPQADRGQPGEGV